MRPDHTGTTDIEGLNHELRPYAALDVVRTSYLQPMKAQAYTEYAAEKISYLLEEA